MKELIPIPEMTPEEEATFWASVAFSDDVDACWPWKGPTWGDMGHGVDADQFSNQYGWTKYLIPAHRIAWALYYAPPGRQLVLHKCDNCICCNPHHLFLGDAQANSTDMHVKGRHKTRAGRRLTEEQITQIKQSSKSTCQLARLLGVSWQTVQRHRKAQ